MLTKMKIIFYYFISIIIAFNISIHSSQSIDVISEPLDDYEDNKWYWNKEEYPNPYEKPYYCRRTKPSFVCDPDQTIQRKEANRLDDLIRSLKNVSICFCPYCPSNDRGLSLGLVFMKDIYKEYNVKDRQNAENFAEYLRKTWNFGICDNNLIVIVITSDNQVAYSWGSVTSKVFPKFLLEDTFLDNKIHFINGDYFKGLENVLKAFRGILSKGIQYSPTFQEDGETEEKPEEEDSSHIGLIIGLVIAFLIFVVIIVFILLYLKHKFSEDSTKFQFKGMFSSGYWLNKNERRPVSVKPINASGGVYEPCSIEDTNTGYDVDKRLKEKLDQISNGLTSSDEEDIEVIEHNSENSTKSVDSNTNSPIGQTSSSKTVPSHQISAKSDVNV